MLNLLSRSLRNPDLAVDLGTALARVSTSRSPSCLERPTRVGAAAAVTGGAVHDPDLAADVLRPMFRRVQRPGFRPSRVLACAPCDASESERENLIRAIRGASAGAVYVVPEPLAAAIGAGADVSEDMCLVVDIGEGVTDCAILAEGRLQTSVTVRGGCAAFRAEVRATVIREAGLEVPDEECDRLLQHIGLPGASGPGGVILALAHLPGNHFLKKHPFPRNLIAEAIARGVETTLSPLAKFVQSLDPHTMAVLDEQALFLTGGGALIPGMEARVAQALQLRVRTPAAPHHAAIRGAAAMLEVADLAGVWSEG
jgi:rod shape-determining protein MreB